DQVNLGLCQRTILGHRTIAREGFYLRSVIMNILENAEVGKLGTVVAIVDRTTLFDNWRYRGRKTDTRSYPNRLRYFASACVGDTESVNTSRQSCKLVTGRVASFIEAILIWLRAIKGHYGQPAVGR